jgi:hypothetical protein
MRLERAILVAFIGTALAAYLVDCSGMTTPDEAKAGIDQELHASSSGCQGHPGIEKRATLQFKRDVCPNPYVEKKAEPVSSP